jgi:hypothetical protein
MNNKGDYRGTCFRSACSNVGAFFFNQSTQKYYCRGCAEVINRMNHEDSMQLYGSELCLDRTPGNQITRKGIPSIFNTLNQNAEILTSAIFDVIHFDVTHGSITRDRDSVKSLVKEALETARRHGEVRAALAAKESLDNGESIDSVLIDMLVAKEVNGGYCNSCKG